MPEILHPIGLFSATHFLFLGVSMLAAVVLAVIVTRKFGFTRNVLWFCLIAGMICEADRILFFVVETDYGFRLPVEQLPFNLSAFLLFLVLISTLSRDVTRRKKLLSFMFPMLIIGAFVGMLFAVEALTFYGLSDFGIYRYFFQHGMMLFLGLYFYLSKPINFDLKSYGYAMLYCIFVVFGSIWINAFFPYTNHMFVTRPPAYDLPILNLNRGWVGYMLVIVIAGISMITLCYLPVLIKELPVFVNKLKGKISRV